MNCSEKILCAAVALATFSLPISTLAEEETLVIDTMFPHKSGDVYVKFSSQPAACAGNFRGFHATLPIAETDLVNEMEYAEARQEPVVVSYDASGRCIEAEGKTGLLRILSIK